MRLQNGDGAFCQTNWLSDVAQPIPIRLQMYSFRCNINWNKQAYRKIKVLEQVHNDD